MKDESIELYIHIPFCRRKCLYCDFLSESCNDRHRVHGYIRGLQKELRNMRGTVLNRTVSSIYVGGGTPSSIDADYIEDIMDVVFHDYNVADDAEISIEVNPGTVTKEALKTYRRCGINRISIGLQASQNELLKRLGRIHTFEKFLNTYDMCIKTGFQNINVDIMSAIPGQRIGDLSDTLEKVMALRPKHISAYSLIVEEGTPFYDMYAKDVRARASGESPEYLPTEDEEMLMDTLIRDLLESHGYHRYEISNYAREGYECRHNNGYWIGTDYLGVGVGAASLLNNQRFSVIRNIDGYISAIQNGETVHENRVTLSRKDMMEEFMYLGLRRIEGVSREDFKERFGTAIEGVYGDVLNRLSRSGAILMSNGCIRLTEEGMDLSNVVLAEFLLE